MKQIHIKLSEMLHQELRIRAAIKGQTLQDYVVDALQQKIAFDSSLAQMLEQEERIYVRHER